MGIDKLFHPMITWACDYLSMWRLKLIHISKRDPSRDNTEYCIDHVIAALSIEGIQICPIKI